jgi:hypothetical protein
MHETLISYIKGYIETNNDNEIDGWVFHNEFGYVDIRIIENDNIVHQNDFIREERKDVAEFYKNELYLLSGFKYKSNDIQKKNIKIQIFINETWENVFIFNNDLNNFSPVLNKNIPSLIVVDNFYVEPNKVREFALKQKFFEHKEYHKGRRTDQCFKFEGLKEQFEFYLNKKISSWSTYGTNGCFQLCMAGEQLVYHYDVQTYAAIIFLTPNAPPETGTSIYRSKITNEFKVTPYTDLNKVFKNGFYDSTQFDLLDKIGNVYNRLLIFDAKLIHSASCYFGDNDNNCRLFQMFFFDVEE